MDDILDRMRAEEAELERKLDAVRHFITAYGPVRAPATHVTNAQAASAPRKVKPLAERMDQFGAYGERVISTALPMLPLAGSNPVRTRDLLERVEAAGVEITGTNKVNALSALLARSSRIKGHGRAGWTRREQADDPHENEASEADAPDASETTGAGVPPPEPVRINPNPWPAA